MTIALGTFVLYDSVRPPLPAGDYVLGVQQTVEAASSGTATGPITPLKSNFRIVGPRFALPKDQQLSVFPPPDSSGAYADRLPQIVLRRRTLPYERRIVLTDAATTTPPWLALVVLAEGEGQLVTNQPVNTSGLPDPQDQDATVQDVLRVSRTVVQAVFPTLTDLQWLTHARQVDVSDTELALDSDGWMSVVIANRLPVPGPSASEGGPLTPRRYQAFLVSLEGHVADLPTAETQSTSFDTLRVYDDATIAAGVQKALAAGQLPLDSVVPADGAASPHLVPGSTSLGATSASFAGRAVAGSIPNQPLDAWSAGRPIGEQAVTASASPVLPSVPVGAAMAGFGLPPEYLDPVAPVLSFTVLANWSFTSVPLGDFRYLMQHLDLGMLGKQPPSAPDVPVGEPPAAPAQQPEMTVLDTGHVTVAGVGRAGNQVTSWYRGPLTPRAVLRPAVTDPNGVLATSSDQLRRIGPDGREDLSRAVAFEFGRALAASTPGLIAGLLKWRSAGYGLSRLKSIIGSGGTPLHEFLGNVLAAVSPDFSAAVIAGTISAINGASLPVRPLSSSPQAVPAGQTLAGVVAAGFGLDATAVGAILGAAGSVPTGGLASTATNPSAAQSLEGLTGGSFSSAVAETAGVSGRILGQLGGTTPVLAPPVLDRPAGGLVGVHPPTLLAAPLAPADDGPATTKGAAP